MININWEETHQNLLENSFSNIGPILNKKQCSNLVKSYDTDHFRSHIHMSRYNFGQGEYKYFSYPLPPLIQNLRQTLYHHLVDCAQTWAERLKMTQSVFPNNHESFIHQCHNLNQTRPTALILKYGASDYNCLHQDLYGNLYFPFQAVIMLNNPEKDFTGGEFVITETRPRMQSKVRVVKLNQGEAVLFCVNYRPQKSTHGYSRVTLRHGVSEVVTGNRHSLGIIFHDAK